MRCDGGRTSGGGLDLVSRERGMRGRRRIGIRGRERGEKLNGKGENEEVGSGKDRWSL